MAALTRCRRQGPSSAWPPGPFWLSFAKFEMDSNAMHWKCGYPGEGASRRLPEVSNQTDRLPPVHHAIQPPCHGVISKREASIEASVFSSSFFPSGGRFGFRSIICAYSVCAHSVRALDHNVRDPTEKAACSRVSGYSSLPQYSPPYRLERYLPKLSDPPNATVNKQLA